MAYIVIVLKIWDRLKHLFFYCFSILLHCINITGGIMHMNASWRTFVEFVRTGLGNTCAAIAQTAVGTRQHTRPNWKIGGSVQPNRMI